MSKSTSLKISLFAFLSTLICIIGNTILQMDLLSYVCQGLGFSSYLFFLIWISQIIYEKVIFAINLIIVFLSFGLATYSLSLFSLLPYEQVFEYYVVFFYVFSLTCIGSLIVLVGRIIFYSPKITNGKETHEEIADNTIKKS